MEGSEERRARMQAELLEAIGSIHPGEMTEEDLVKIKSVLDEAESVLELIALGFSPKEAAATLERPKD